MSKKPDDSDHQYVDLRYVKVLLSALEGSGLTPEQGFITLMFAARMLAEHNGVSEETMVEQFKSIEFINERRN
jgi:hypothetical protein